MKSSTTGASKILFLSLYVLGTHAHLLYALLKHLYLHFCILAWTEILL